MRSRTKTYSFNHHRPLEEPVGRSAILVKHSTAMALEGMAMLSSDRYSVDE